MQKIVFESSFLNPFLRTESLEVFLGFELCSEYLLPEAVLREIRKGYDIPLFGQRLAGIETYVGRHGIRLERADVAFLAQVSTAGGDALGAGESEGIALCLQHQSCLLANEDKIAIRIAQSLGVKILSIADALEAGIRKGKINAQQAQELVERFAAEGKFVTKTRFI